MELEQSSIARLRCGLVERIEKVPVQQDAGPTARKEPHWSILSKARSTVAILAHLISDEVADYEVPGTGNL